MRSFVPFPAVLLAAACTSCGIADGASNSIGQASSDVPETLSAAVAAAQANADRFSSGDFAGVWERMSREVRDGITREDFVTFYETCKKTGQKIRVAGVRLDAGNAALVRMEVGGTDQSRVMLFENGNRVMKPTRLIQVTPNPSWRQTLAASAAMKPPPMIRWDGYGFPSRGGTTGDDCYGSGFHRLVTSGRRTQRPGRFPRAGSVCCVEQAQ